MGWLYVFIGGGLGSMVRFGLSQRYQGQEFPTGTFIANVIACLLLGFLMARDQNGMLSPNTKWLLATGFCGGLSTFSTMIFEIFHLCNAQNTTQGIIYLSLSVVLGFICMYLGMKLN